MAGHWATPAHIPTHFVLYLPLLVGTPHPFIHLRLWPKDFCMLYSLINCLPLLPQQSVCYHNLILPRPRQWATVSKWHARQILWLIKCSAKCQSDVDQRLNLSLGLQMLGWFSFLILYPTLLLYHTSSCRLATALGGPFSVVEFGMNECLCVGVSGKSLVVGKKYLFRKKTHLPFEPSFKKITRWANSKMNINIHPQAVPWALYHEEMKWLNLVWWENN